MSTEQKLQALKGKRIDWRSKVHLVKSARQINTRYLVITDSKTMNLDEDAALHLLKHIKVLN
jgi:hypothetical protein